MKGIVLPRFSGVKGQIVPFRHLVANLKKVEWKMLKLDPKLAVRRRCIKVKRAFRLGGKLDVVRR
jgi:hypothetical protein